MRKLLLLSVLALVAAGCSRFESWFQPAKSARSTTPAAWTRPETGQNQLSADVASCRARAAAIIQRDRTIDSDIGRYDRDIGNEVELRTNMDQFGEERRFQQIIGDCMRQLGYGERGTAGAESPTPQ